MADTKFTAGPWSPSEQRGTPGHCTVAQVFGPDGKSLAMIEPTVDAAEATANAHLASAAPELYEMLHIARDYVAAELEDEKQAYKGYESSSNIPTIKEDLERIDAALAKARGETV